MVTNNRNNSCIVASCVYNWVRLKAVNETTQFSSFTIMKMKMCVILVKAKPHTENIKGLNLAAVIYTTVQVSRLVQDV
jgi:hypothetical protein